jgi:hypothetical protein
MGDYRTIRLNVRYQKSNTVFLINDDCRIFVKPYKRIFSKEDPYGEEDWGDIKEQLMTNRSVETCITNGERFNIGDMVYFNNNIKRKYPVFAIKGTIDDYMGRSTPIYWEFNLTPGDQYEIIDIERGRDYYFNPVYRAWLFDNDGEFIWVPLFCLYKEHPRIITEFDPYGEEIWDDV